MVNVQKMHNDLERSGENDRRRLESQMQMLEGQTYGQLSRTHFSRLFTDCLRSQDLRTQVSQERDNLRRMSFQKDIEVKELQTRLDKSVRLKTFTTTTASFICVLGAGIIKDSGVSSGDGNQQKAPRGTRRAADKTTAGQRGEARRL